MEGLPVVVLITAAISVAVVWILLRQLFSRTGADEEESFEADRDPLLAVVETTATTIPSISDIPWSNTLTLFVNGTRMNLTNPDPSELLATFVRDKLGLKGTKLGCEEGGCGACTVVLTKKDYSNGDTGTAEVISINSCLRLLCLNDGK